jgi:hypothetical protein
VGLRRNEAGQTELHFANVHLGHLAFDAEGGRFKPTAYIAPARPALNPPAGGEADRLPCHPSAQSGEGREPSPLP